MQEEVQVWIWRGAEVLKRRFRGGAEDLQRCSRLCTRGAEIMQGAEVQI
jgi:hypothetical protein